MKSTLLLLALVAAPTLAQTQSAPVRVAKAPQAPMPKAQELLDNLFAPYAAAKTFSGNFDISIRGDAREKSGVKTTNLKTRYRFDDQGNLQGDDTTVIIEGKAVSDQKAELRYVRNGAVSVGSLPDKKIWWEQSKPEFGAETGLSSTIKTILDAITEVFSNDPDDVVPLVSRGVDAGQPALILKIKGRSDFRVVFDAKTRAIRSLDFGGRISMRGFDQVFDEPMTPESFVWAPPADYKKIAESEVEMPELIN